MEHIVENFSLNVVFEKTKLQEIWYPVEPIDKNPMFIL